MFLQVCRSFVPSVVLFINTLLASWISYFFRVLLAYLCSNQCSVFAFFHSKIVCLDLVLSNYSVCAYVNTKRADSVRNREVAVNQ